MKKKKKFEDLTYNGAADDVQGSIRVPILIKKSFRPGDFQGELSPSNYPIIGGIVMFATPFLPRLYRLTRN